MPKPKGTSRRDFVKGAALGAGGLLLTAGQTEAADTQDRMKVLAALGDTIIPSKEGKPGFRDLEPYGIVEELNRTLRSMNDSMFSNFNEASRPFFKDRPFLELSEDERAGFLKAVISGDGFQDAQIHAAVRRVYRLTRIAVLKIFYSNFPEHRVQRDSNGIPMLKPGDTHQITNPNTDKLVTGWDIAGYQGPLTWEQEEKKRSEMKKIHWHENLEDLIVRYRPLGS